MAFTAADEAAIDAAIASGVLEVRYGDRIVRYQSLVDLIKARDVIRAALAAQAAAAAPSAWPRGRKLVRYSSGLASSDSET